MCPKCGGPVHRSRTRGLGEKLVKLLSANRTYRCFECGWRGWLQAADISQLLETRRRRLVRTIISVIVTILVTALLALYLVRNSHAAGSAEPGWNDASSQSRGLDEKTRGFQEGGASRGFGFSLIRACVFCKNRCPGRFFESKCSGAAHWLLLRRQA
jgi:hypothetical protein